MPLAASHTGKVDGDVPLHQQQALLPLRRNQPPTVLHACPILFW